MENKLFQMVMNIKDYFVKGNHMEKEFINGKMEYYT
jgi:hypothetical protein